MALASGSLIIFLVRKHSIFTAVLQQTMFRPELNPYVAKIQDHTDVILPFPTAANPDCIQFDDMSLPVIVDVGCGAGNFLRDYALKFPQYNFVGIELRFKRLVKSAVKFKKHNLQNIRLIQTRAEYIDKWFKPSSVRELNINFPDPWPKKRQQKHRLITGEYLELSRNLLGNEGNLVFKTDHQDYFHSVNRMIQQCEFFEIIEYSEDLHQSALNERNIPTEFEQLFKSKGIPVYYLRTAIR